MEQKAAGSSSAEPGTRALWASRQRIVSRQVAASVGFLSLGFASPSGNSPISFHLPLKAYETAKKLGARVHVGGMFASDTFYNDDPEWWRKWAAYGALVVEMETSALYTPAAKFGIDALSVLTVSDSLASGENSTAQQRKSGLTQMTGIALEIAP